MCIHYRYNFERGCRKNEQRGTNVEHSRQNENDYVQNLFLYVFKYHLKIYINIYIYIYI